MKSTDNTTKAATPESKDAWLETVRAQVSSLRYGIVQIVVHDSQVVQIERTEKVRFDRKPLEN
jgi:hypothetical protein